MNRIPWPRIAVALLAGIIMLLACTEQKQEQADEVLIPPVTADQDLTVKAADIDQAEIALPIQAENASAPTAEPACQEQAVFEDIQSQIDLIRAKDYLRSAEPKVTFAVDCLTTAGIEKIKKGRYEEQFVMSDKNVFGKPQALGFGPVCRFIDRVLDATGVKLTDYSKSSQSPEYLQAAAYARQKKLDKENQLAHELQVRQQQEADWIAQQQADEKKRLAEQATAIMGDESTDGDEEAEVEQATAETAPGAGETSQVAELKCELPELGQPLEIDPKSFGLVAVSVSRAERCNEPELKNNPSFATALCADIEVKTYFNPLRTKDGWQSFKKDDQTKRTDTTYRAVFLDRTEHQKFVAANEYYYTANRHSVTPFRELTRELLMDCRITSVSKPPSAAAE